MVAEGSADPSLLPETNEVEIVAAFNLQRVGLLRESRKVGLVPIYIHIDMYAYACTYGAGPREPQGGRALTLTY